MACCQVYILASMYLYVVEHTDSIQHQRSHGEIFMIDSWSFSDENQNIWRRIYDFWPVAFIPKLLVVLHFRIYTSHILFFSLLCVCTLKTE